VAEQKAVYRVQGFSCAGCAKTFENNVKNLKGVKDAEVNFGASKVTVYGDVTIKELEKAGAFEKLKIYPENEQIITPKEPFLKRYGATLLSIVFLIIGWGISLFLEDYANYAVAFYIAAIFIGGFRLFETGLKNLVRLQFDMKTLMTIAIIGAAIIGEWGEGATVVILFAISEALESYSMERARKSIQSLMDIAPKEALILRRNQELKVKVEDIQIGDLLLVKPGQKIAMDGVVVSGASSVNQAAITGESIPVWKQEGDEVFAGTLNGEGFLRVEVTKRSEDTTLAKIIHLVEEAQAERAPSQAFIDRFAKYYTPLIMVIALLVAVIPPLVFNLDWLTWIYQGLAVLVVGCPCALVISTPVAVVTAIGNAARNGVLIKGGIYLEEAGKLKAIAFDKTGTITTGKPVVTNVDHLIGEKEEALMKMAALESQSQHPLAFAVVDYVKNEQINFPLKEVQDFSSVTGKGITGIIDGVQYYVGSPNFVQQVLKKRLSPKMQQLISKRQSEGKTVVLFSNTQDVLLVVSIADKARKSSRAIMDSLKHLGIQKTIMLTGDNNRTAKAIGQEVHVSEVIGELLPEEKANEIKKIRNQYGKVAMVGDGVNDAPALAQATVGFAMGASGTDTALETADIALMGDDLKKLPFTIRLSRKTLSIIKQNITFSIGIKVLALLLVVPGWLTLWIAIFADMGATLLVTLNALRLLRMKEDSE